MAATVNLRAFPYATQVSCPHCHQQITLYDPDGSEYVVCDSCNSYCLCTDKSHLQVHQSVQPIKYEHILEIGNQGTLYGTPYKVLAYLEKKEAGTEYEWQEYMLYSFTKGYAFLAVYCGHWSFIAGVQHFPEIADTNLSEGVAYLNDVEYLEYNRYSPVITALKGEFDWDICAERILAREFINPPFMLVREKNKKNEQIIDWYFGQYIEPKEIADAFNIPIEKFPERTDIGAIQPNRHKKRWGQSLRMSIAALALMVIVQVFFGFSRGTQTIINKSVDLSLPPPKPDSTKRDTAKHDTTVRDTGINAIINNSAYQPPNGNYEYQSLRTSTFTIYSGPAPVDIDLSAPLDNNWFEATVELVNEKTNETWDVSQEFEYYSGYEDGESWSEGSNSATVTLDDIPRGTYHINIYPYAGSPTMSSMNLAVTANVILWQNLLITTLLLCIVPLIFWYLQRRYEVNRWMASDFSPYNKPTSSDD
jgi:hypothetical protein